MVTGLKLCSECGGPMKEEPRAVTCSNACRQARFRRLRREKMEFIVRIRSALIIEPVRIDGVPHIHVSLDNILGEDRFSLELLAEADLMDAETWVVENIRETLQEYQAELDRRRRRRQGEGE